MIGFRQPKLKVNKCTAAYNCKKDEENNGYYICDYLDEDDKVKNISCSSIEMGLSENE